MGTNERVTTSIKITAAEWRCFKIRCLSNEWDVGERVANLIRHDMEDRDGVEVR